MKDFDVIFDNLINDVNKMLEGYTPTVWKYDSSKVWPTCEGLYDMSNSASVIKLGGSLAGGVNFAVPTTDQNFNIENEIRLYGPDLKDIKNGAPLGRISLMVYDDEGMDDRKVFNSLVDIGCMKHRVRPEGYKVDYEQALKYEVARVNPDAIRKGISFERIGNSYIKNYFNDPRVKKVTEIFITDSNFDFDAAQKLSGKVRTMTVAVRAHAVNMGALRN